MTEQTIASRYRLDSLIAIGGMGEVWRAHDSVLDRLVAIKLLHPSLASDQNAASRFKREAFTSAKLTHPNIAEIYDFIDQPGRQGIVMELVEGEDLARVIARSAPLSIDEAIHIATAVLDALDHAHHHQIVHRDIKPANILITNTGTVKVVDFGIARARGEASLTTTGTVMGTAHYASPEQIRGEHSTPRSDLYSLAIVLYEMLSGRKPFDGESQIAIATARLSQDPPPLHVVAAGVPAPIVTVVSRALSLDPARRPATAAQMRDALASSAMTDALPLSTDDPTVELQQPGTRLPESPVRRRSLTPRLRRTVVFALGMAASLTAAVFLAARGPATVAVPDLTGTLLPDAAATASRLGITVETVQVDSSKPAGTVIEQDIAPRIQVRRDHTTITLTVSDGTPRCCAVPNVVGMSIEQARHVITAAGLDVGTVVARLRSGEDDGTIVDQNPRASVRVRSGDPIDLIVAREEEPEDAKPGKGQGRDRSD